MRILAVDDDQLIPSLVSSVLKEQGYEVHICTNGTEALQLCHLENYDCLITDWLLDGEIQGGDLVRALRTKNSRSKIAVLTGMPPEALQKELQDYPDVKIVEKAIDLDSLLEQIRGVISLFSQSFDKNPTL